MDVYVCASRQLATGAVVASEAVDANKVLAIPAGTATPTQLPAEFHSRIAVHEITDSEFPGYVYLVSLPFTRERSFSAMRRVRIYLRTRMSANRFTALSALYIERDISNNIDVHSVTRQPLRSERKQATAVLLSID